MGDQDTASCVYTQKEMSLNLSVFPRSDTSGINETCINLGVDRQAIFGDKAVFVEFGWIIVGALWIMLVLAFFPRSWRDNRR